MKILFHVGDKVVFTYKSKEVYRKATGRYWSGEPEGYAAELITGKTYTVSEANPKSPNIAVKDHNFYVSKCHFVKDDPLPKVSKEVITKELKEIFKSPYQLNDD